MNGLHAEGSGLITVNGYMGIMCRVIFKIRISCGFVKMVIIDIQGGVV